MTITFFFLFSIASEAPHSTWNGYKCLSLASFLTDGKISSNLNTPLLNMDVLIFLLMVMIHLHPSSSSLTRHKHWDKNYDHRGNCMLFWQYAGHFKCQTLLTLVPKSFLSGHYSPNYFNFLAYWHCSHQYTQRNCL